MSSSCFDMLAARWVYRESIRTSIGGDDDVWRVTKEEGDGSGLKVAMYEN